MGEKPLVTCQPGYLGRQERRIKSLRLPGYTNKFEASLENQGDPVSEKGNSVDVGLGNRNLVDYAQDPEFNRSFAPHKT